MSADMPSVASNPVDVTETSGQPEHKGLRKLAATMTIVISLVNIITGMVVDFALEWGDNFWAQSISTLLIVASILAVYLRGYVSVVFSVLVFWYFYSQYIYPVVLQGLFN